VASTFFAPIGLIEARDDLMQSAPDAAMSEHLSYGRHLVHRAFWAFTVLALCAAEGTQP